MLSMDLQGHLGPLDCLRLDRRLVMALASSSHGNKPLAEILSQLDRLLGWVIILNSCQPRVSWSMHPTDSGLNTRSS